MHRQGFTLVEMLIVVAIVGILAAIGVSGYISWRNSSMVREAQQTIAVALAKERTEAKRLNEARKLVFGSTGLTVTRYASATATGTAGRTYTWPHGVTTTAGTSTIYFVPPHGEMRVASGSTWGRNIPANFGVTVTKTNKSGVVRVGGVFGKPIVK